MSRMLSKQTILFFGAIVFIGCSGKGFSGRDIDLLTNTPWKYEKAGFGDDDGNFNALDPQIAGNEKDNTLFFRKDGTGYSQQVVLKGKQGSPDSLPFIWAFQNNDSTIYFQNQYYKVRTLNKHRLEMYADQKFGGVNTRYTIVLSH